MGRLMDLIDRLRHRPLPEPPPIDHHALREEMAATDPDYARIRQEQHDALQALTAKAIRDGIAIRRERLFWERHSHPGGQSP